MVDNIKWIDRIGIIIECYLVKFVVIAFLLVFGVNHFLRGGGLTQIHLQFLDEFLINQYKVIFAQNIGTVTTIASVFVGIYFTVLSILGGLKLNSILAVLGESHLLKLIRYLKDAMAASFLLLFYSLIIPVINNEFWMTYFFFTIFLYMVMTAIRFGVNIIAIYEHDFAKLKANIEVERKEKNKMNHVIERLDLYLQEIDLEKAHKKTADIAKFLETKKKDQDKK